MSRTVITPEGAIVYRTTLLSLAQADSFAKCLQANRTRFTGVEINPSERAKGEKYFVTFRPVNIERQKDLYAREWDKNQSRADEEGADYIYFQNSDNPSVMFVFNPKSGQTWEMFSGHCQCPHNLFRCEVAALQCKHELELERRRREGLPLDGTDKVTPASALSERRAAFLRNRDLDF